MTGTRDDNEYARVGPRDYKNLHHLHQKVNKPAPTRILPQTKPKFSYAQDGEPRLSFLSQASKLSHDVDPISSDYGDEWMDDLPSASALLGQRQSVEKPAGGTTPRQVIQASIEEATPSASPVNELADSRSEEDISELEAAMIGMDDSRAMTKSTGTEAEVVLEDDGSRILEKFDEGNERHSYEPKLPGASRASGTIAVTRKQERLFLSTDSPDKPSSALKRRPSISGQELPLSDTVDEPPAKRRRHSNTSEGEQDSSRTAASMYETAKSSHTLETPASETGQLSALEGFSNGGKPLPAWVKDFDPTFLEWFLRDYGHIVQLV